MIRFIILFENKCFNIVLSFNFDYFQNFIKHQIRLHQASPISIGKVFKKLYLKNKPPDIT